jgi:chorismate mutase
MKNPLDTVRQQIDDCNEKLLDLLAYRARLVAEVAEIKLKHNLPALQPARYDSMLNGLLARAKKQGLDVQMVEEIFDAIHRSALRQEESFLKRDEE